jgi:hypothetical protein
MRRMRWGESWFSVSFFFINTPLPAGRNFMVLGLLFEGVSVVVVVLVEGWLVPYGMEFFSRVLFSRLLSSSSFPSSPSPYNTRRYGPSRRLPVTQDSQVDISPLQSTPSTTLSLLSPHNPNLTPIYIYIYTVLGS